MDNSELNADIGEVDEAYFRRLNAERDARVKAGLAEIRARECAFDPQTLTEIQKKRSYRRRQPPPSAGPSLSGVDQHLLARIAELNDLGVKQISIPELAASIGCEDRSIQRSLKKLEGIGYVRRRLQPTSNPRRHRPSIITLADLGWLRLNRIAPASKSPDVGVTKMSPPSEIKIKTSCTKDDRGAADAARSGARATPTAAARQTADPARPEPPPPPRLTTGEELSSADAGDSSAAAAQNQAGMAPGRAPRPNSANLAQMAAAKLHPARAPIQGAGVAYEVIDAVRRQRLSLFNHDAWSRAVEAHGRETALLAAALALLRPRDGRGRPIRSAASYLGGMLRQSPGALNPVPSLSSILRSTDDAASHRHATIRL